MQTTFGIAAALEKHLTDYRAEPGLDGHTDYSAKLLALDPTKPNIGIEYVNGYSIQFKHLRTKRNPSDAETDQRPIQPHKRLKPIMIGADKPASTIARQLTSRLIVDAQKVHDLDLAWFAEQDTEAAKFEQYLETIRQTLRVNGDLQLRKYPIGDDYVITLPDQNKITIGPKSIKFEIDTSLRGYAQSLIAVITAIK